MGTWMSHVRIYGGELPMARQNKEYEIFSARIYKECAERLTELNKETGIPKTAIVEKAVNMFYDNYKRTGKISL